MIHKLIYQLGFLFFPIFAFSQGCCSGGVGSPIAGGASTGVLQKGQWQLSTNYQFNSTDLFLSKDSIIEPLYEKLYSNYLFSRADYGLSEKLTFSLSSGYFFNKSMVQKNNKDTIKSNGIGDFIIFPRYNILNNSKENKHYEITIGIGYKIPLGSHNDSNLVFSNALIGDVYAISPPSIQCTNGSHDIIFYTFWYKEDICSKWSFFINTLHIKKSYNSLGQKFGDYSSVSVFASKILKNNISIIGQIKGERVGRIHAAENINLLAFYNIDELSTGSRKIFFIPQISYGKKSIVGYITSEIPLYQYMNGTQVGSKFQHTAGIVYNFYQKNLK